MKTVLAWVFSASLTFAQLGPGAGVPVGPGASSGGNSSGSSGTVTSIAAGCQAAVTPNPITTTGTISTSEPVNLQAGSNYAILTTDCGALVQLSNAGAQAPTIAQAGSTGFAAGWFTDVVNTGAGTQTITPATSTINGAASYALAQNQGVRIVSDGTNYQVQPGTGGPALPVSGANGGTGVANTAKTITLGASVTTTGAGAPTLAFPGTPQTYTFPSSADTLAGLLTFAAPPAIGNTTPAAGSFTTLSASSTVSGTGFSTYLASPPAVGGSAAAAGSFTTLSGSTNTKTPILFPPSDSTTALQITKADGSTRIIDIDTTNARVGINKTPGAFDLDVNGAVNFASTATIGSNATIAGNFFLSGNTATINLRNGGTIINSPATAVLQTGSVDAASPVAQTIRSQGSRAGTDSNVGGANLTIFSGTGTGTGTPSTLTLQSPAAVASGSGAQTQTTGIVIGGATAGAVLMPNLAATSAAQTGTVCWTTGGGNLTVDTTVACLASLEELKNIKGPIVGALGEVLQLKPFWYSWKDEEHFRMDPHDQPGLGAHQVESVDPRLSGYSPDGELRGVRYQQLTALLIAAIQEQQKTIETLERRVALVENPGVK